MSSSPSLSDFFSLSLSEGGGQTQDGLSVLGCRGDRLWDDLQRLRVQLHTGLRGHTHDEVRVCVCCLQFYSIVFYPWHPFPPIHAGAGRAATLGWPIRRAPRACCWLLSCGSTVLGLRPGTSTTTWTQRRPGTGSTSISSRWRSTAQV